MQPWPQSLLHAVPGRPSLLCRARELPPAGLAGAAPSAAGTSPPSWGEDTPYRDGGGAARERMPRGAPPRMETCAGLSASFSWLNPARYRKPPKVSGRCTATWQRARGEGREKGRASEPPARTENREVCPPPVRTADSGRQTGRGLARWARGREGHFHGDSKLGSGQLQQRFRTRSDSGVTQEGPARPPRGGCVPRCCLAESSLPPRRSVN